MNFKDRLREEIEYQGKLVKEISAEVGISNSTFLSYIDARNVLPNVETAVKIARALNTTVEYLVTGENTKQKAVAHESPKTAALNKELNEIVCDLKKINKSELKTVKSMIHALVKK